MEGGKYVIGPITHSSAIGIWQNLVINCVWISPEADIELSAVIDFFDLDGQLLTSIKLKDRTSIYFSYIDQDGKIYAAVGHEPHISIKL